MQSEALLYTTGGFIVYNRRHYYIQQEDLLYTTGYLIKCNSRLFYIYEDAFIIYNRRLHDI